MEEQQRVSKYVTPPGCSDWFTDQDDDSDNEEPIPLWVIYQRKQKERAKEKRDALFIEARVREKLRAEDKRERKKKRLEKRKNDKILFTTRVKAKVTSDIAKQASVPSRVSSTPIKKKPPANTVVSERVSEPVSNFVAHTPSSVTDNGSVVSSLPTSTPVSSVAKIETVTPSTPVSSVAKIETVTASSCFSEPELPQSMFNSPYDLKNHKCTGCRFMYDECCERRYKKICLNAVFDYISSIGVTDATGMGIRKAYHQAYIWQLRCHLMTKTGFYETNHLMNIPKCMILGSLNDALMMRSGGIIVNACKSMRKHNIEECMRVKESKEMFKDILD